MNKNYIIVGAFISIIVIAFVFGSSTGAPTYKYGTPNAPAITKQYAQKATFGPAQTVGVKMTNPKKSGDMIISYDLELGGDVTSGLSSYSKQLEVSNQISSGVSQGYSLATDGLKALLGLPGIPSAVDVLAGITSWLNKNAPSCLRQIGTKYNGKTFKGKYTYEIKKGKGSSIYPNWDYFYATETFSADGFKCVQGPSCVFTAEKDGTSYSGKTSTSCFG